jgi:hypothetical protein
VVQNGQIYTSASAPLTGAQGSTAALQYLGNGQWQTLSESQIAAGAVGNSQLAAGAVTSSAIANGAVGNSQIAAGAVGSSQLAAGAVTSSAIANGAVGNSQIAAGAVGSSQLATGAVTSSAIANGAVGNVKLVNSALTVTAGTGLSGGGAVSLGGSVTLNNAGVTSLTGDGTITVSASTGAVTLHSSATATNTASTIVWRDSSRNFAANTATLSGNLALPTTSSSSVGVLSIGGTPFLHGFGNRNTCVGPNAGNFAMGPDNTAVGYGALNTNTSGYQNIAIGAYALSYSTNGSRNTAVGYGVLRDNTNGTDNIAIGFEAGWTVTGSYNIDIGNYGFPGEGKTIRIGTAGSQTSTYIAGISGATASGGSAVYVTSAGQLGTVTSSRRFKEAIQDMGGQSDVLLSLRPVSFRYKPEIDPQGIPQFGLIAEEVEQVAPELVVRDAKGAVYSVRYEQVNAMLLNEFLKQHRQVQELKQELQELKAQVAEMRGGRQ